MATLYLQFYQTSGVARLIDLFCNWTLLLIFFVQNRSYIDSGLVVVIYSREAGEVLVCVVFCGSLC